MAAKPAAPCRKHSAARGRSIPPMASTGMATATTTPASAASPAAARPGWDVEAKTGPKST